MPPDYNLPSNEVRDKNGNTLLLWAVQEKRNDILLHQIRNGANINQHNYDGDSAVHLAVKTANQQALFILAKTGANLNTMD